MELLKMHKDRKDKSKKFFIVKMTEDEYVKCLSFTSVDKTNHLVYLGNGTYKMENTNNTEKPMVLENDAPCDYDISDESTVNE